MRFENEFEVEAPLDQVWDTVLDVERVAPTVPGAQVLERSGDDAFKVAIKVKVGPMSMTYRGEVEITERDETAHRAVMKARAKESRGQGMADADVTMVLSGDDGRTSATVTTDVELSGKVATMGQGVLQDVSGRLAQTFADNLAAMLEGGGEPASSGGHARTAETGTGAASTHGEPGASASTGQTAQTATGAAPRGEASAAGSTVQAKSAAELAAAGAGAAGPSAAAAGAGGVGPSTGAAGAGAVG